MSQSTSHSPVSHTHSQQSTLINLIDEIETSMIKLKYDEQESADVGAGVRYHKKWSPEER